MNMIIEFDFAKSIAKALEMVKSSFDGIRSDLPPALLEPQVSMFEKSSDNHTLTYAVFSSHLFEEELSCYVDNKKAK